MAKADYYVPDDRPWFKYYPENIPHHLDYPEVPLYQFLDNSAEKYPNNISLVFYGKEITYQELKELTDRFAHSLQDFGIQKGDRVFFLLPNCPQFVIAFYGTMKAGAIPVPFNPLYSAEELKYFFKDAEPRIVLTLDTFYSKVKEAAKVTPQIEKIIVTNISDYFPSTKRIFGKLLKRIPTAKCEGATSFMNFLKNTDSKYNEVEINPKEDVAVIVYTGGTTGDPKGVMLTHWNLASNTIIINKWEGNVQFNSLVLMVPLFHVYGITLCLSWGIIRAAKIIILPSFSPKEVIKIVQKQKVNYFPGVPAMYAAVWKYYQDHPNEPFLTSLTLCGSGTTSFSSYLWEKVKEIAPNALLGEGYGLSETSPLVINDPGLHNYDKRFGSVGVPVFDTDVKIIDPETKEELPPGKSGELIIRGPQIFKGYWRKPEKTKEVLRDGWLYTKDIGRMDEDGIFYIEGRLDDMINVRGEKVWPREIEKVLEQHPKVKEVAVVGVKDDYYGQAIKACVVLREGYQSSEKELIEFCKDKLAPHKVPQMVEFFDELPKSNLGKVLHYKLREKANQKQ